MKKWWIGVVVAAVCVGQSAWAQSPPGGGGLLPEPAPVAPCPPQDQFTPGPMMGPAAPPGPGDALSLPASLPTAWGKGPVPESNGYVNVGTMGFMRQRPGHSAVAEDNGAVVLDTGFLRPGYQWGPRLTVGYLCDDAAIEFTGYYIPEGAESKAGVVDPGHVAMFFQNAPAAFQRADGGSLWQGADAGVVSLQTMLADAELNYRWFSRAFTGFEGVVGFRFVELQERARVFVDDEVATRFQNGGVTPSLMATYQSRVHNHLVMGQTGFDWSCPLRPWLMVSSMARFAAGGDNVDQTTRLFREDGATAFNVKNNHWTWSTLYELGVYFDFLALDKVRLRAGWQLLWALHVDEAFQRVSLDLANQPAQNHDGGSIFYQGPVIEVQFLF